jgi:holo-[acyl-carrier protein] synthase
MIISVGTDLVKIARVEQALNRWGLRFVKKLLTSQEQLLLESRPKVNQGAFLAKQFAAKEAVCKALGTGMRQGVSFPAIEIPRNRYGTPWVKLSGAALARQNKLHISTWHLSISDESGYALAFVVAEDRN